ncbi:unnamed protein product [Adineta steineri]|uniref:Uncharacterized protein n=1 Tax=Adineta steineri TaxID=433720 RepID=A0A814Q071_9BILA|nr:unnamed protein product [Adineta steineri]CAF3715250.1 unnamed protein product [Adineta steineri]
MIQAVFNTGAGQNMNFCCPPPPICITVCCYRQQMICDPCLGPRCITEYYQTMLDNTSNMMILIKQMRSKCCSKQCLIGLGIGLLIGIIFIVAIAVPVGVITRKCGLGTVSSTPNWIGTYQMDNACDTSICCCYTNQVFFSQITSNQLQISGSVTGACSGSSSTATLTLSMPSTFQTLLIWSTETIRLQLGQDNSYISFVNTARGSCSTSGMRTSYNTDIFIKRPLIIQSDFYLSKKMKLLNDNKQFQKTLELFDQYKKNKSETFSNLQLGKTIHHLISSHIEDDSYISTSLIHLYMQCNDVPRAQSIFDKTTSKTLAMYGYIKTNQPNKAIDIFNKIKKPNEIILRSNEALNLEKKVSQNIPQSFYSNHRLLTSLLDALIKCADLVYAQSLFDTLIKKDSGMYAVLMNGYNKENNPMKTLALSQISNYELSQSIMKQISIDSLTDNHI